MSWTLCTSGAAFFKAGLGMNDLFNTSGAYIDYVYEWSNQAEASVNAITRKDWTADYASVGANFKEILGDVVSDLIAMKIICFDMSGYTSRTEAQTMLDVLRDNISRNLETLKDQKNQEKM